MSIICSLSRSIGDITGTAVIGVGTGVTTGAGTGAIGAGTGTVGIDIIGVGGIVIGITATGGDTASLTGNAVARYRRAMLVA